jgi:hypothetical protein
MKLVSQCIGVHWQICVFHKLYWKWQWTVTRGVQGLIKWECLLANTKNPHVMAVANHGIVSPFKRFIYLSSWQWLVLWLCIYQNPQYIYYWILAQACIITSWLHNIINHMFVVAKHCHNVISCYLTPCQPIN